jgi:hypothetical protein
MQQPTRSELRRFGVEVGSGFQALGLLGLAIGWWRGNIHEGRVIGFCGAGATFYLFALLAPGALRPVQRFWMGPLLRVATAIGTVVFRVLFTVLYFLVFTPFGIVMRRVRDPLNRSLDDPRPSQWIRRERAPVDAASYERSF